MATYGRQVLNQTGRPLMVLADLAGADWKPGGVTIDWSTVTAVEDDTTLIDETVIPTGQKGIELGAILAKITASGKYGPYDDGASDGRQTLAPGDCYILNETVLEQGAQGIVGVASDHPAVFDGGLVWRDRLAVAGSGEMSFSTFEAAFPRIRYADV